VTAVALSAALDAIYSDMVAWCKEQGGVCNLSSGVPGLYDLLGNAPKSWRVTIHWTGDRFAGSSENLGPVSRQRILFLIDGNLGPTVEPGVGLIRPTGPRNVAFADIIDAVRARAESYRFLWLSPRNDRLIYQGTDDRMSNADGSFLAIYSMEFALYVPRKQATETIALNVAQA